MFTLQTFLQKTNRFIITWAKIWAIHQMGENFKFQCCQHRLCQPYCMGFHIVVQQNDSYTLSSFPTIFDASVQLHESVDILGSIYCCAFRHLFNQYKPRNIKKRVSTLLFCLMFLILLLLHMANFCASVSMKTAYSLVCDNGTTVHCP